METGFLGPTGHLTHSRPHPQEPVYNGSGKEQVNSVQEGLTWTRISQTRISTQTSVPSSWRLGSGLPSSPPAYSHAVHHSQLVS